MRSERGWLQGTIIISVREPQASTVIYWNCYFEHKNYHHKPIRYPENPLQNTYNYCSRTRVEHFRLLNGITRIAGVRNDNSTPVFFPYHSLSPFSRRNHNIINGKRKSIRTSIFCPLYVVNYNVLKINPFFLSVLKLCTDLLFLLSFNTHFVEGKCPKCFYIYMYI